MRIDPTNKAGEVVTISKILLNKNIKFNWHIGKILLSIYLIILAYIAYLIINRHIDFIIRNRYRIALVVFILLVVFRFHGSSIGMWDNYITAKVDETKTTTIVGKNRAIRSDEWLVQSPYALAQSNHEKFYPKINDNIRSDGQNMVLANAPTFSIETIGKPFNWGFLLLGMERGLSWLWYSKLLALILLSFEICRFITNNRKIALLGSIWITLSPAIQWWYSTAVVELIIYSQGLIVSSYYYTTNKDKLRNRILFMFLFTICAIGYILTLYPAVQVPLGFLTLIFIGYILKSEIKQLLINKKEILAAATCLSLLIVTIVSFIYSSYNDIQLMLGTAYPGKRISHGGEFNLAELQYYLISWLLPFKEVNFKNNSEVSSFINFFPLFIFIIIFIVKKVGANKGLFYSLFGYLIFQFSWLIFKYPEIIAKLTLFSFVPEERLAGITFGLTATYLSIWMISILVKQKPFSNIQSLVLVTLICAVYLISLTFTDMSDYLTNKYMIFTLGFFLVLNLLILKGKLKYFSMLMLTLIIISGATVNPLAKGTDSIYNKVAAMKITKLYEEFPKRKWVAVDSLVNGQFLLSLGVKTFNSVHFYPDLDMWRKLDENMEYSNIYNRYAHVKVSIIDGKTYFQLDHPDAITVYLNYKDLSKADIKYVLSPISLNYPVLQQIDFIPQDNLYIYRVND
ncbi:hypothetical protein [Paenibacillus sp. 32O-W]|uniref:DUF7657 domain-containing protein n=1 Tax=Paenibacillus sp. 32O-W TaxID=1695218 RepID=UPI0011A4DA22|nr:hypothetical protein [Paenibacillus sp. 32O-W]